MSKVQTHGAWSIKQKEGKNNIRKHLNVKHLYEHIKVKCDIIFGFLASGLQAF
jgi:hypothetical protein